MPKVCLGLANTSQMMLRVDDLAGEDAEGVEHRVVVLQRKQMNATRIKR